MRQFINQLKSNESINEVYQVNEKFLRANTQGKLYSQFLLCARTGMIDARYWTGSEELFATVDSGDYVKINGFTQKYQGNFQMVVREFEKVDRSTINEDDFLHVAAATIDIPAMVARIREMFHSTLQSPDLLNLADCYLADAEFMDRFCSSPAGIKLHHAYRGGLLEHTVSMMEMATRIAPIYGKTLNQEILLLATFLHDTGKIEELTGTEVFTSTDAGQLLGHPLLGIRILDKKISEVEKLTGEPIEEKNAMVLRHLIISHHGELANGSPKLPMTLEAIVLHYLDSLDAKLAEFQKHMIEDPSCGSSWTNYIPAIERKLFKG